MLRNLLAWSALRPFTQSVTFPNFSGDGQSFDGIYLDLHGAEVCKSFADGKGKLLRQIRAAVGDEIPLAISLDLHANISPKLADYTSAISNFQPYPHLDMADIGARCAVQMCDLSNSASYEKTFLQFPYLIPLHTKRLDMTS